MKRGRGRVMAFTAAATMVAVGGWAPAAGAAPTATAVSASARINAFVAVPPVANLPRVEAARRVAADGLEPFWFIPGCWADTLC